ncbi:MAG: hypothetical protein HY695_38080 [Deltaproteobacteria bacterium]|nr:hypothetical protein [Deltaproteobacteria bacterium]
MPIFKTYNPTEATTQISSTSPGEQPPFVPSFLDWLPQQLKRFFLLVVISSFFSFAATGRPADKELEALSRRVGQTYWITSTDGPTFFSAPSPSAPEFNSHSKESFDIMELVKGSDQRPYYKVRLDSGKEGFISVSSFLENLNSTVATSDPEAKEKKRLSRESKQEKEREKWVRSQSWQEHIKEAVLKRQAVLGMNMSETKIALGKPSRVVKVSDRNRLRGQQEQWVYEQGVILTFTNGLITRIQSSESGKQ